MRSNLGWTKNFIWIANLRACDTGACHLFQKRFRVTWWSIPRESADDGTVYGFNVNRRKPPIGTLPVNQEGTAQ